MIGTAAFQDAFETAQRTVFRLETLQHYTGDPNFDRYQVDEAWQDTGSKRHWVDLVRRRVTEGVVMQRVHVVTEPWSDYVRLELTWSYPPNVAAGEEIGIIAAPKPWPGPDFWMFDDQRVWLMHYNETGALERVEDASAANTTVRVCLARKEQALAASAPLPRAGARPLPRSIVPSGDY